MPPLKKKNLFARPKAELLIFISSICILALNICFAFMRVLRGSAQDGTFLRTTLVCASSCVSLKNLGQSRQSHTGCICLIFPAVCFQMCPQMVPIRGPKVTLVTFV